MTTECHGITETDGLVLHEKRAWHNLGITVLNAPSPREAARIAGIDWEVELWPNKAHNPRSRASNPMTLPTDRFSVVRMDNGEVLGQVGNKYTPCQNMELAEFCETLSIEGNAKIESAGTIFGGRKVWFLLQKGSISLRNNRDITKLYWLVASSHDGTSTIQIMPTGTRVVCRNTLRLALGMNGTMKDSCVSVMHSGDMQKKLAACQEALVQFEAAEKFSSEKMNLLAEKPATVDDLREFWTQVYQRDFGKIPPSPVTLVEKRLYLKAMESFGAVQNRFTREIPTAGSTWWNVLNAYTGYLQHDTIVRGKNAEARYDKRTDQRLFGTASAKTSQAWRDALALAS